MTATIGDNSTPFIVARDTVNDALLEARAWCDGAAVVDQEQADGLAGILDMLRKASKAADEARKLEAKPFDDGKAEVQARYKPLLTNADRAIDAVKAALTKWQAEQKRIADETARIAREAAEKAAQQALEARRAADMANLAEREKADAALAEAERLAKAAKAAEDAPTGAKGMFAARATALITKTEAVALEDAAAALKWMKEHQPHFLKVALLDAIHKGRWQNVPGVTYETTQTVR